MKPLLFFRLKYCPHCIRANKWLEELMSENPAYKEIDIRIVDEAVEWKLADSYDYYLVPTFFSGDVKLHEGVASKAKIKAVLDYALAD